MDFDFSTDQDMLRDTVRKWVAQEYPFAARQKITANGGYSSEMWQSLAALGLTGLAVPEDAGGMGFGAVEAMIVMEELGRGLVLEPYAAVALVAADLLRDCAAPSTGLWLQGIARGDARVVLAHQERAARYRLAHCQTQATQQAGNWVVQGVKSVVPAGEHADAFIVPARVRGAVDDAAGIGLFLVSPGPRVTVRGYPTQDGACAAEVSLDAAEAVLLHAPGDAYPRLERAVDVGIAASCAEAVGAMDQLFAMTVDYMNTRRQFGVPIASFQALRHRVADMKMQLELARSMSYFATLKLGDEPAVRRRALSQAKVQLGQSMRFVGQQAVQLHGGIGMTLEYAGAHYFKRLTCIELSWGDTLHHLGEVSARMQATAGVFA